MVSHLVSDTDRVHIGFSHSSSNVDVEIRWCILKLCEVLIKPSEEALPKIKLRMSSNAARVSTLAKPATSEVPLALASGTGGIPRIKIGGPESAYKGNAGVRMGLSVHSK